MTYQQWCPANQEDTGDPQELDQRLCGDPSPLLAGVRHGRFVPAARHHGLHGDQVAHHGHHEREDPQEGKNGGEDEVPGELAVAGADKAPGPRPLHRVLSQADDRQEPKGADEQADAKHHQGGHPHVHVAGVPVGRADGQSPLHGHDAGDEERAEPKDCHVEAEEDAEVVRGVDGVPGAVGQVDGDDDGADEQLPQQVGERQGEDTQQEGSLLLVILGSVAADDQHQGQYVAHQADDHEGERERHGDSPAARRPLRPVFRHGAGLAAVGAALALRASAHPAGLWSAEGPLRARAAAAGRGVAGAVSAAGRCAAGGAVMRQGQAREAPPPARGREAAPHSLERSVTAGTVRHLPRAWVRCGVAGRGWGRRSGPGPLAVPRRRGGSLGLRAGVSPPAPASPRALLPPGGTGTGLVPCPRGAAHPATGPVRAALGQGSADPWLDKDSSAKPFLTEHDVKLSRSPVKMRLRRTSAPTPRSTQLPLPNTYFSEAFPNTLVKSASLLFGVILPTLLFVFQHLSHSATLN